MRWVYLALLAVLPSFAARGQEPSPITCQSTSAVRDGAKSDLIEPDPILAAR